MAGNLSRTLSVVMIASGLSACATVVRGPNVDFAVISEPPEAQVTTDLQTKQSVRQQTRLEERDPEALETFVPEFYGCPATPCTFKVSRRAEFNVKVQKDGYHTANVEVTSGFGRKGTQQSAGGAVLTASGAYLVSYGTFSTMISLSTLGLASSGAVASAAGSAAATGAAGLGVVLVGVDLISGAMLDVRPNPLALVLIPADQPLPEGPLEMIESEEELKDVLEQTNPAREAESEVGS